jgi:integrase
MATVNLLIRSVKNPANIIIRFTNGRALDFFTSTNIFINPIFWDKERQQIKKVLDVKNRDVLNSQLQKLKINVVDEFNMDYINGIVIDKNWLDKKVSEFFKRPKGEENKVNLPHNIYITDFIDYWLKNIASEYRTSKKKVLDIRAIQQYNSMLKIVREYEKKRKKKLKFTEITSAAINDLISFMEEEQNYAELTISRHLKRLFFFCYRAEEMNISVNNNYKKRYFIKEDEEVLEPYLNEAEIESIFKFDFSNDATLDNVRDNFIIGLWTGLRISDFNGKLNINNIKDDFIEVRTKKTNTWVTIPVHPMIKVIIEKRNGLLPEKLSDQKFNKHIKTICKLCDIDQEMKGKLFDSKTKRNKVDIFEKHLLVSSHICRRSFATNLFGLVPNSVIQSVGGWASESMMLHYIKKSKREHAEVLRDTWKKKYQYK